MLVESKTRFKRAFFGAIEPISYFFGGLAIFALWKLFGPSDPNAILSWIQSFLLKYGLWATLFASFIEGIVLINLYFPGSIVIVAAILAVKGDPYRAAWVVAMASLGFFFSALLNYYIGHAAFRPILSRIRGNAWIERVSTWQNKWGRIVLPLCFIHPNLGAFVSVASGRSHMKILVFVILALGSTLFWNSVWGILTYQFSDTITEVATNGFAIILALATWAVISFLRAWRKQQIL